MFKMAFFVSSSSLIFLPEIENQTGDEITLAILNAIAFPNPLVAPVMMTYCHIFLFYYCSDQDQLFIIGYIYLLYQI